MNTTIERRLYLATLIFLLLPLRNLELFAQQTIFTPLINHSSTLLEFHPHLTGGFDKCGPINEKLLEQHRTLASEGWGYDYEELIEDIVEWKKSPYVSVTSIGK